MLGCRGRTYVASCLHSGVGLRSERSWLRSCRAADGTQDQVLLTNQDRLTGEVKELPGGSITVATAAGDAKLPMSRVEAVIFAKTEKQAGGSADQSFGSVPARPQPPDTEIIVGMRDGSLLHADRLVVDDKQVELELLSGVQLAGGSRDEIVLLQPLGGQFVLSLRS